MIGATIPFAANNPARRVIQVAAGDILSTSQEGWLVNVNVAGRTGKCDVWFRRMDGCLVTGGTGGMFTLSFPLWFWEAKKNSIGEIDSENE